MSRSGHKNRWQARFEGMDGAGYDGGAHLAYEQRIRNLHRSREARREVEAENRDIERTLGLRVR